VYIFNHEDIGMYLTAPDNARPLAAFCPPPTTMMKAVSGETARRFSLPLHRGAGGEG
jgi:hypothetical protein